MFQLYIQPSSGLKEISPGIKKCVLYGIPLWDLSVSFYRTLFAGLSCNTDEACIKFLSSFYLAVKITVVSSDCH